MGLLGTLLSSNKRKWLSEFSNTNQIKYGLVIKNFFIRDNINYDMFKANDRWASNKLSVYPKMDDLKKCSPTYRKCYAENSSTGTIEAELGYNDWFYLAYPDVAKWFENNFEPIKAFIESKGTFFHRQSDNDLQILRYVVTMYRQKFGKLECSN